MFDYLGIGGTLVSFHFSLLWTTLIKQSIIYTYIHTWMGEGKEREENG
jgi:hypothetical protein